MIWLLKSDHPKTTEFAPAMTEGTGVLPGLPAVVGKPVHVGFDGGRLTSDAGILLLSAVEQRLRIAELGSLRQARVPLFSLPSVLAYIPAPVLLGILFFLRCPYG